MQDQLRTWFACWGLPEWLRVDNGCPWGGWFDLPTPLELWLAGLGVGTLFNPPRTPQDNGVIEKSHDTGQRWGDVAHSQTVAELRAHLAVADLIQRERYPSIGGQSRLEAFPGLAHSGREYRRESEEATWDLAQAEEVLEGYVGRRRVTEKGQVCVYHRRIQVGKQSKGTEVLVRYDSGSKTWAISREGGQLLRAVPAVEITAERIRSLSICDKPNGARQNPLPN